MGAATTLAIPLTHRDRSGLGPQYQEVKFLRRSQLSCSAALQRRLPRIHGQVAGTRMPMARAGLTRRPPTIPTAEAIAHEATRHLAKHSSPSRSATQSRQEGPVVAPATTFPIRP